MTRNQSTIKVRMVLGSVCESFHGLDVMEEIALYSGLHSQIERRV